MPPSSLLLPPWTPFVSSGALRPTADRPASQGVRSSLASLVAATPLDPFRLLGSAPPHGGPLREPGGPQLPRFARCCYPPGPFSSPRERSASRRDRSASQGVRSCLASLVAATPLDPFRLLGSAPPHGGTAPRARGSAAASLGSLLLPPWTPSSQETIHVLRLDHPDQLSVPHHQDGLDGPASDALDQRPYGLFRGGHRRCFGPHHGLANRPVERHAPGHPRRDEPHHASLIHHREGFAVVADQMPLQGHRYRKLGRDSWRR